MPGIFDYAFDMGWKVGELTIGNITYPKFVVNHGQHRRIMEVLGIHNNGTKKAFGQYVIVIKNNGGTGNDKHKAGSKEPIRGAAGGQADPGRPL